jgi:hypothetical protein
MIQRGSEEYDRTACDLRSLFIEINMYIYTLVYTQIYTSSSLPSIGYVAVHAFPSPSGVDNPPRPHAGRGV